MIDSCDNHGVPGRSARGQLCPTSMSVTAMEIWAARHAAERGSLLCRATDWLQPDEGTGELTRPGISVWTCSASTTWSAVSGGRSAVCKSYQKTLWCLHPVEQSRDSVHEDTAAAFDGDSLLVCSRQNIFISHDQPSFKNASTCNHEIFHKNRIKMVGYYLWLLELLLNKTQFSCRAGARKSNHTQLASVGKHRKYTGEERFSSGNLSSLSMLWLRLVNAYIEKEKNSIFTVRGWYIYTFLSKTQPYLFDLYSRYEIKIEEN